LSKLGRVNSQFVWVCLKLPMAVLAFALAIGIVRRAGFGVTTGAQALMVAGWWLPVIIDMQEGQTNFLALLPLLAGLYVAQNETPAAAVAAGLLVSLGVAMKVTPVIFVAYFVWRRRFVVAASVVAGLAVWSFVVPGIVYGWDQNLRWLGQWANIMIVPYVTAGKVLYATSQSVGSFALRLLSETPAFLSYRGGGPTPHYMNVLSLSEATVRGIVRVAMLSVAAAGLWWMRKPLATLSGSRYVVEVGLVAAFMLWFSERTWAPHYVSFLLTLAAAGMLLSDATRPVRSRDRLRRSLVAFAAMTFFASDIGRIFGPYSLAWILAAGIFLWPSVFVALMTVRTSNQAGAPGSTAAGE
jgi:hypothetical protein